MPEGGKPLSECMSGKVSSEYYSYLLESGLMRLDDDSTPPHTPEWDEDSDEEEVRDMIRKVRSRVSMSGGRVAAFSH